MKKQLSKKYQKFVIRKSNSWGRRLFHLGLFTILWCYVIFVLIVNLSFLGGYYSDDFVSYYLLLNLNYNLYIKLIIAIVILIALTSIYSIFRLIKLRRVNKHVNQK